MAEVISVAQFPTSKICMATFASIAAKEKVKQAGQLKVKGKKCLVLDPNSKDIKVKPFGLRAYLEERRAAVAIESFGKVRSVVRENWRDSMENMETMKQEVSLTLHDAVTASDLPQMIATYGVQSLASVLRRVPLCPPYK